MVDGLLDTSIIVDFTRAYRPAVDWLSRQTGLAITPIVVLELLEGANNKRHAENMLKRLQAFNSIGLIDGDYIWAINHMSSTRLSHNVDTMDCLIAAPAFRLQLPLYTRNLRHFTPLLGALAVKPY
jgi:predicted nucleic acid-binding protein